MTTETPKSDVAVAKVAKRTHFAPIWLIPILVGLVVIYVGYTTIRSHGKTVTLTFASGDGLAPGETTLKHKNVQLGVVEDVRLSDDLKHVDVTLKVNRHEAQLLTEHARFWVVRPRLNGNISNITAGLETLVSGAYIEVDPGKPGGKPRKEFVGLEDPPGQRSDEPLRVFVLKAQKLGSLGTGSPVFFHETVVGEVLKSDIGDGRSEIDLTVFVRSPFDKHVVQHTHFWNTSGLSLNMGPEGLHLEMQSLQAVLSGGIAFEVPDEDRAHGTEVQEGHVFSLYDSKASADAAAYDQRIPCATYFASSVQGLAVGAPVQMLGSPVGVVRSIEPVPDPKRPGGWLARVGYDVQPERLPESSEHLLSLETLRTHPPKVFLDSTNFLTGQKALTFDFANPKPAKPGEIVMEGEVLVLPGEAGGIDNVAVALGHIAGKLEQIPFDDIGKNLDQTLVSVNEVVSSPDVKKALHELSATMSKAHHLLDEADRDLTPALKKVPGMADQMQQAVQNANNALGQNGYGSNSDFQRNMSRTMLQISDAVRSVRLLADFLDRHPEALIKGRTNIKSGER